MTAQITITPQAEPKAVLLSINSDPTVDITASPAAARGLAVRLLAAADEAEGIDRELWIIQNNVPKGGDPDASETSDC